MDADDLFDQPSGRAAVDHRVEGFPAKYPGICGDCDEEFERATMIRYEDAVLVHADPGECVRVPTTKVLPCNVCMLQHAGECF